MVFIVTLPLVVFRFVKLPLVVFRGLLLIRLTGRVAANLASGRTDGIAIFSGLNADISGI